MTTAQPQPLFYDLSLEELQAQLKQLGEPAFRARQLWQAIYCDLITSPDEITTLPKTLRQKLGETFTFNSLIPARKLASSDNQTIKTLFTLPDQRALKPFDVLR